MTPITLALIFAGIALTLFIAEVLLPSHGILGTLCVLSVIVALIFCFTISVQLGVLLSAAVLFASPFAVIGALRLYPHTPIGRRMTLRTVDTDTTSPTATDNTLTPGSRGITTSALRPIGTVDFDGNRVESFSDTGHLPPNTAVVVTHLQNNRPVVRPIS